MRRFFTRAVCAPRAEAEDKRRIFREDRGVHSGADPRGYSELAELFRCLSRRDSPACVRFRACMSRFLWG
jgi:hypothetical protein